MKFKQHTIKYQVLRRFFFVAAPPAFKSTEEKADHKEKIREIYDKSHQNYSGSKITREIQKTGERIP